MTESKKESSRILIVDDEPAIRDLLCSILSEKHTCKTAESAEAALSLLENEVFELVISDINMGGMSGLELVARVVDLLPDTVVMVISGDQEIDSPIEAIRNGVFDYIRKPFDLDSVVMAVDRALTHAALLASKRRHENHLEQLVAERTERVIYLAYHDPLTGLPNRCFFEEKVAEVMAARTDRDGGGVFVVSLDRFQGLRDTLGNELIGQLLTDVAKRLEKLAVPAGVVARFEGDEFAVLRSDSDADQATAFGDAIRDEFRQPFLVGEYELFVTASVGISLFPIDGVDAPTLIKHAGSALSYARTKGENSCQLYTAAIHAIAVKRAALENDLRRALERSEFELYYQPKVDVNTRRITGMEALIRWNHPQLGLISPVDFIPIAEETGLIVPLGEWIIRTACSQGKKWHDKGKKLYTAVNLSVCQFQQRDLVETIRKILLETGFDASFLNLEVTESSIMNNTQAAVQMLRELRELGISISIDDFGTGHSSLGQLKHLPIDVLKIDKSFIDDVTRNQDDAALAMAIISLAHTLRLKVVAEGVETEEQLRFLRLLRCDEWQGFLFSKPVPAIDFEKLLSDQWVSQAATTSV